MSEWLTAKQVAQMLQVSPSTPGVWIHRGVGLPYIRIGRTIRFNRESLERFLSDRESRTKVKNFEK